MTVSAEELNRAGYQARHEGRSDEACKLFARAALFSDDVSVRIDALRGWANSESDLGELEAASKHYAEAIALLRQRDEPLRLAHAIRHRADVARKQGLHDDADSWYDEALAIYRTNPGTVPLDWANALRGYALLKESAGGKAAAQELWTEALGLYEAVGVQAGVDEAERRLAAL